MHDDLVFKTGAVKQAVGWFVSLGAVAAMLALIYGIFTTPSAQTPPELASGAVIVFFLIGFMPTGFLMQKLRWSIDGENIVYHGPFKKWTIPISKLAGFGHIDIIVLVFPLRHVDFYDTQLTNVARLPIRLDDWPKAEAWLAARLRYVVNDGSQILPKRRFADTPKS